MRAYGRAYIILCPSFHPFLLSAGVQKKYVLQHVYQSACYEKVFIFRVKNPLIYLVCML